MNPNVYAVVVTYNGEQWIDRCFGSLANVRVIAVDNASSDHTCELLKERFPSVEIIESPTNLGFAKANNIGIRRALDQGAEYVFLLNQDAWVNGDAINVLERTLSNNPNIGIASPIHLNGKGSELDWGFAGYVPRDFVSDMYFGHLKNTYFTGFVNAAAWMISRKCLETVGGFDTSLFIHYGEDENFSQRMVYHGFKTAISTECSICHDREFRRSFESEYRNKIFKQTDIERRLEFGNINYDIDIDSFIKQSKISILKSFFKLKLKQAKKIRKDLDFFVQVKYSRETNKGGGANWL